MNQDLLVAKAKDVRVNIIDMIYHGKSGHPGGSLSCADILTYLYFEKMEVDVANPKSENRDRFVLSKGHGAPALYSVLGEKGFFDKEEFKFLRKLGSVLQGHPDAKKIPGVDVSTGSLGQGISNAVGMALGLKTKGNSGKVYTLLGDGEIQEGLVWEAAMAAAHYKLNNLIAILDYNQLQIDGRNEDVMGIHPVDEKFAAFGWNVEICDGHDFAQIHQGISKLEQGDKPGILIANTIKGKGVSFMENNGDWHGQAPNEAQRNQGIEELRK